MHLAGENVKEINKTLKGNDTDQYNAMCVNLINILNEKKISHERYIFTNIKQNEEESTVSFITRLRKRAEYSAFPDIVEAVKDQIYTSMPFYKTEAKTSL